MEHDISIDTSIMNKVIKLSAIGEGIVNLKPRIGAVTAKEGKILGLGYTLSDEDSSAEVRAIEAAGKNAKGAELYINIEPDIFSESSTKIIHRIKKAGIKRVIIAIENPKASSCGRWIQLLRENGTEVKCGISKEEALKINEIYVKYTRTGIPFIVLKTPISICNGLLKPTLESEWTLDSGAREIMQKSRRRVMGIMTDIGTILNYNPTLISKNINSKGLIQNVVILDSLLRIPLSSAVFKISSKPIIACTNKADKANKAVLEREGAKVIVVPEKNKMIDLTYLLIKLGKLGLDSLLIEGSCELVNFVLKEDVADKIICFTSPKVLESENKNSSFSFFGSSKYNTESIELRNIQCLKAGRSLFIEGYNKRNSKICLN